LAHWLAAPPDKVLALVAQMDDPAAMPAGAGPVTYACPMHPEVTGQEPGRCPKCGMKLLAAATMPEGGHDPAAMGHGAHDHDDEGGGHAHGAADGIEWEDDLHGAGRFLVLARDGVVEPNLVWKDIVLVRTGQVVDILFDVTNPGLWMAHCHIAEHMQSGMMFSFNVTRDQRATSTKES
jgi:Multicopper oxidase/Heavy metal binding domain